MSHVRIPKKTRIAVTQRKTKADSNRLAKTSDSGSNLTADVSDLEGLVTELGGKITDSEIFIELPGDILFDFDKSAIRSDAVPTLEKLVRLIKQPQSRNVQINGHTDSIASDEYNQAL